MANEVLEVRNLLAAVPFAEQPALISSDHAGPIDLDIADLDGDGDPDLLAASFLDGRIAWYENLDGQGNYARPRLILDRGSTVAQIAAVDVDGDQHLDVVASMPSEKCLARGYRPAA